MEPCRRGTGGTGDPRDVGCSRPAGDFIRRGIPRRNEVRRWRQKLDHRKGAPRGRRCGSHHIAGCVECQYAFDRHRSRRVSQRRSGMAAGDACPGISHVQSLLRRSGKSTVAALAGQKAFVSADGGLEWKQCAEPSPTAVWYGLAFDGASGTSFNTTALAATSEGMFRSNDGCSTWAGTGLQTETVSVVLFHPTRAGEAFASQGGRVFSSGDAGLHWYPLNDEGRGASWPSALLVLPAAPERLFALFPRRGIFSNTVEGPLPATAH